jgi:nucleoid DNA-binding protein
LEALMTFNDLVTSIGEETGIPSTKVVRVLRSLARIVTNEVMSGAKVRLWKFGIFYGTDTPENLFGKKVKKGRIIRFRESRYHGR